MTSERHLERDLPAILGEIATGRYPDYIDDVLATTARRRQRPAWTFPERWLPVELVTSRVGTTRMPWRQMGVLALLLLLIAAALIGYLGSQQTRLPAPFGPAANGVVAYAQGGDIYTADPVTRTATRMVASPEMEFGPRFSRDGTRIVFARSAGNGRAQLYVVRVDGSELTRVTSDPIQLTPTVQVVPWEEYQFSPDGRSILIAMTTGGKAGISIAQSDGSVIREVTLPMSATEPSFRPDGSEILFVGETPLETHGVFGVDPSTGVVRTIVEPTSGFDLAGANWSPDGTRIAYWAWGDGDGVTAHTHMVSADGTGDRLLPIPPDAVWQVGSDWSNEGSRLFMLRGYTGGYGDVRPVVIPVDGSSFGVELAYDGNPVEDCCSFWEWAPDDTMIIGTPAAMGGAPTQQVNVDPVAGGSRPAPWASTSDPTWQRVAR